MRVYLKFFFLMLSLPGLAMAAQNIEVKSLRYWTAPDHTRLVFDVSNKPEHKVFLLENPHRLVIDLSQASLKTVFKQPGRKHPVFTGIRSASRHKNDLRIVVDLKASVNPKSMTLKPNNKYGHRLVVDLYQQAKNAATGLVAKTSVKKTVQQKARDIVVAIDAGHGGEDPGALGKRGTREKDVVFSIAKKLAKMIDKQPGMKAVMVRKGDYYIKLRERINIARKAKADLFVSIHADAFKKRNVKGASVFTLSRKGASSEAARWLAAKENNADLVGGVSLDEMDDTLASVLLDLSQTASKEASREVAGKVLKHFKSIGHLHNDAVQKAGFAVLKSPDIPSILVETAFISNPDEEAKLRNAKHQQKMAAAIFKGVLGYFKEYAPADTLLASIYKKQTKHIITRGETLSGIAVLYGVSMKSIKSANALVSNTIRIGQVLKIPLDG